MATTQHRLKMVTTHSSCFNLQILPSYLITELLQSPHLIEYSINYSQKSYFAVHFNCCYSVGFTRGSTAKKDCLVY